MGEENAAFLFYWFILNYFQGSYLLWYIFIYIYIYIYIYKYKLTHKILIVWKETDDAICKYKLYKLIFGEKFKKKKKWNDLQNPYCLKIIEQCFDAEPKEKNTARVK